MAQTQEFRGVHTTIYCEDGWHRGIYRGTVVVKWNADKIVLNTGGWRTNTTKNRMNQASNQFGLGYSVFQRNFDWWVECPDGTVTLFSENTYTIDRETGACVA